MREANAYIYFSQDGGGSQGLLGHSANAGFDPRNNAYTDVLRNALLLGTLTSESVQIGTNQAVRLTILGSADGVAGNIGIGTTTPDDTLDLPEDFMAASETAAIAFILQTMGCHLR